MKERILRFNLYVGLFVLISSAALLALQISFVKTWFFSLAWWSFILLVDSLNFRKRGSSLLSESPRNFVFTAFISVFVWLIFELFNLILKNWSYHDLPESLPVRWLGYFIAFATVVPAMREIAWFMEGFFKKKNLALFRLRATPLLLRIFYAAGVVLVLMFILWPRIFFPCAWLCFIFLVEPINIWLGNDSLWKDIERRDWTRFWSWVSAGLVAGFFWEFWNFWTASRWEYSLPYLNFWRIFQMPVFGYTGFLPFALEIFALYQILLYMHKKLQSRIFLKVVVFVALLLVYAGTFMLIDTLTVQ